MFLHITSIHFISIQPFFITLQSQPLPTINPFPFWSDTHTYTISEILLLPSHDASLIPPPSRYVPRHDTSDSTGPLNSRNDHCSRPMHARQSPELQPATRDLCLLLREHVRPNSHNNAAQLVS